MLGLRGTHFPADVILVCNRWYAARTLSYRHLEEMNEVAKVTIEIGDQLDGALRVHFVGDGLRTAATMKSNTAVQTPRSTEGQLQTAREHAKSIPADVAKDELSDLISQSTWRDKQASADLQAIAQGYGVKVTKCSGNGCCFNESLTTSRSRGMKKPWPHGSRIASTGSW